MNPLVTIIWLNYNSGNILNTAKESLLAIKNLTYSNYELILVDNGSTDNSLKQIIEYLTNINLNAKVLKSYTNIGFTGGNNFAYRNRNPQTEYIALINSDLVPEPNSLNELINAIESDKYIGSVQGIIFNKWGTNIDISGAYLDEALSSYPNLCDAPTNIGDITYASGCYCIVRVDAIRHIQGNYLFEDELFAYFEDILLGIKFWNNGYTVKSIPVFVGRHIKNFSSGKSYFVVIQNFKNREALRHIIYTKLGTIYSYKIFVLSIVQCLLHGKQRPSMSSYIKAFVEGLQVGSKLRNKGISLSLYKAPYVRINPLKYIIIPKRMIVVSLNDIVSVKVNENS